MIDIMSARLSKSSFTDMLSGTAIPLIVVFLCFWWFLTKPEEMPHRADILIADEDFRVGERGSGVD
jgi:hypothetical protein